MTPFAINDADILNALQMAQQAYAQQEQQKNKKGGGGGGDGGGGMNFNLMGLIPKQQAQPQFSTLPGASPYDSSLFNMGGQQVAPGTIGTLGSYFGGLF